MNYYLFKYVIENHGCDFIKPLFKELFVSLVIITN